ncbi:pirin family protein [Pseudohaliea rubra]|uniref:Pirin family protein n=1 Tax=Pseudohaliea rubra DSM 19751 TaxID=1265313 RepID=A0A095VTR9_9GAMM|nr:pirin family protein [Pseudohaliea rubra]KGE04473.1 pirin family protein [Pseudohaliea rubra DSM 19751]
MARQVTALRRAQATSDGAGVAIQRVVGFGDAALDPLLMLDELRSEHREDFAAGFPPHPHRGMQTLTYMKHGGIAHEDSQGNRGEIRSGGLQWMSAGRGIIHSEMPTQDSAGLHGFQLWVNLPAAEKLGAPRYRDIEGAALPRLAGDGFEAALLAGDWHLGDVTGAGALPELTPQASLADLTLAPGATVTVAAEDGENLVAYLYDGALAGIGAQGVSRGHLLVAAGDGAWTLAAGSAGAGLLVLRGRPLCEPVVHYGPFVMNTREEIEQALAQYRDGTFLD